ncbi:MAG: tRNA lysidine(34) synthetase TilS [Planctomycetota bacterium]|nr:tRNA lysidine(34) synthetase TilS [Planctomycetota bacterium]
MLKPPLNADLLPSFVDLFEQAWPTEHWIDLPIVLAVSGGSDSVALLLALTDLRDRFLKANQSSHDATPRQGKLIAGHYHHGIRGSDADRDAAFVKSLCDQRGIMCEIGELDTQHLKKSPREGWESTLRKKRYAFLTKLAERNGARYVVTGHTMDDQVETILHRVVRGTGLRGLSGMPRSRPLSPAVSLIRPMLTLSRCTAQEYLKALGVEWQTDLSNESEEFTRNRIRHDLLPLLEREFNPQAATAILRLGHLAGEAQETIDKVVTRALEECSWEKRGETIEVEVRTLRIDSEFLLREMLISLWQAANWPLQAMGLSEWQCLVELIKDPGVATRTLPGGVVAKKEGGKLSLHRPA